MDRSFASNMDIDTTGYTKNEYYLRDTVLYKNSIILCGGGHTSVTQPYTGCDKYNTDTGTQQNELTIQAAHIFRKI